MNPVEVVTADPNVWWYAFWWLVMACCGSLAALAIMHRLVDKWFGK